MQLAGRLENWTILKNDDIEILSLVESYILTFHKILQQKNIPNFPKLSQEDKILDQLEIHEMLNKGNLRGKFTRLQVTF